MQHFDWQTDEDETLWAPESRPEPSPPPKRRRWAYLLVAVATLLAAGLVVGRQVNQRIKETQVTIEADVLAADRLARTAATEGDGELLITLLSGRDRAWTLTQEALLEAQLLYGRAGMPFGLTAQPDQYGPLTVEIASDLNEALVSGEQVYTVQTADGEQSVTLDQTWVYRRGRRNWLLSPPDDTFWGSWETTSGRYVTLVFPLRDEEFALSFARDLDEALADFCAQSGLDCPGDLRLRVRLETDPQALLNLADPQEMLTSGSRIELPTISLVGSPVDQEAYAAIVNGYTAQVLSAAIGEITGWECCDQLLYYQTLVDYLLAEQEIRFRQLAPISYLDMVNTGLDDNVFEALWDVADLDEVSAREQVLTAGLIEFLLDLDRDPAEMLDRLVAERRFSEWLQYRRLMSRPRINNAWDDYVRERVLAHQETIMTPADFPQESLVLFCSPQSGEEENTPGIIMRYHPLEGSLVELAAIAGDFALGSSLSGTNRLIYTVGSRVEDDLFTTYWQLDESPIFVEPSQPGDITAYIGQPADPQGEQVPVWVFNENDGQSLSYSILDLAACTGQDSCPPKPVSGMPVWSPSGAQIVLEEVNGMMLWGERDLESWTSLGPGRSPVWLDEEIIAYLNVPGRLIRMNHLGEERIVTLFNAENIHELLPQRNRRLSLELQKLLYHPARPDTLLLLAAPSLSSEVFMFAIRPEKPETDLLAAADSDTLQASPLFDGRALNYNEVDSIFSADGRWLTMRTPSGDLLLYDQETQTTTSLVRPDFFGLRSYSWSSSSAWLAYIQSNYIEFIRPEPDGTIFHYFYFPDDISCGFPSWVQP